ncbi:MAG: glycosyltransferase, partial [Chloroflexi bacterium]|nr:glycosyltransferase [Chloroflexota bacterium]
MLDRIATLEHPTPPLALLSAPSPLALSVVIPVYNEEESVPAIYARISEVLAGGPQPYATSYEIIFVDDGSRD